jgi:ketosteroid isomerase-like protein
MTTPDEVDVVRRVFDGLNRRDIDGALQHVDPGVRWHMSGRFARMTRVFEGHDGIREVVALFDEALDDFTVEPVALHAAGPGTVIAELRASGLLRGTGEATGYDLFNLLELRDGRVSCVEAYASLEEAWAAAGMTPPAPSSASISPADTGRENR